MELDDDLCLCFHISWRKVLNFLRIQRVKHPSQLSECGGAGTGCGWCRRSLTRLCHSAQSNMPQADNLESWLRENSPHKARYAEERQKYIQEGKGTPPPSTANPDGLA